MKYLSKRSESENFVLLGLSFSKKDSVVVVVRGVVVRVVIVAVAVGRDVSLPQSPGNDIEQEVPDGHFEHALPCSYIWPLM